MEEHIVKVKKAEWVTYNVRKFRIEKPEGYSFTPGQATEVAINKEGWKEEKRPFTFTSLNKDPELEFTIKIYTDHDGVTNQLGQLKTGDELLLHDVWGTIQYKGPGVFIAGGAGITPFIAILRSLDDENKINGNRLIFSNRTSKDIILRDEFNKMLGERFINTLTEEDHPDYDHQRIDREYLEEKISDFEQHFYVCGPSSFVEDISEALEKLGTSSDSIVFEE